MVFPSMFLGSNPRGLPGITWNLACVSRNGRVKASPASIRSTVATFPGQTSNSPFFKPVSGKEERLIVYWIQFDKTRLSRPWNSKQNCTQNSTRGGGGEGGGRVDWLRWWDDLRGGDVRVDGGRVSRQWGILISGMGGCVVVWGGGLRGGGV